MRPLTAAVDGTVWGIVLAAGSGQRFGASKQFADLNGERLIDRAITALAEACDRTLVVVPGADPDEVVPGADPDEPWKGPSADLLVAGGRTRAASVRAALARLPEDAGIVVVHGAAHPLASSDLANRVVAAVRSGAHGAVPGLLPADHVHRVRDGYVVEDVGRDDLITVQSPCAYRVEALREAYAGESTAVEDSQLLVRLGMRVAVVPGERHNLHVVTMDDLLLARHLAP